MTRVSEIIKRYNRLECSDDELGRQFHRLSDLVDTLDKFKLTIEDLNILYKRFRRKSTETKYLRMHAECSLICCHIAWLGRLLGDHQLTSEHQKFALEGDKEGLLASTEETPEKASSATFFLPTHERSVGMATAERPSFRKDLFETTSKKVFFQRIQNVLAKTWPSLESAVSTTTLDTNTLVRSEFLQFMHKQLLQNVLTHAYAEAVHNPNYTKYYLDQYKSEGADFLFGSIAYLEVRRMDPAHQTKKAFKAELASYHQLLSNEADHIWERLISRKSMIIAFSYCDTGPGIERHIRHFSPTKTNLPQNFDIRYVIDNRVAGRAVARAGEGLADIRKHSRDARATLVLETTDSCYLHSAEMGADEVVRKSRVKRGTSVSILIET